MDKTLIYQAIENPALRAKISVEELERIQAEYPYFSTAHVLLAKLYQEKNDHRFADQLQQAAVYASDRTVLYDYIKKVDQVEELEELEVVDGVEKMEELEVLDVEEKMEELEVVDEVEELEVLEENEKVEALDLVEELEKLEELTLEQHEEEDAISEEESSEEPSLESSVRKAVSAAFEEFKTQFQQEKEEEKVAEESDTPDEIKSVKAKDYDPLDRDILVEAIHSSIEMELDENAEEELEELEKREELDIEKETEGDKGEKSYAQLMMERAARIQSQNAQSPAAETTPESLEERKEIESKPQSISSPKMNVKSPLDLQKSLIDKFIREQPKITPGKASDYTHNQNLGKESYEEDFTVVTETMAKLFVAQGKIDKARKVYRQLIALYPEKSIYFAAQLKNLNQNKKI